MSFDIESARRVLQGCRHRHASNTETKMEMQPVGIQKRHDLEKNLMVHS